MEDIKNRITERNYHFLKKFENYIGVKLIFFGSVKRCDYFEENSDIDIAIISDNVQDTLTKIKFFLDLNNSKIRKIFQKFPNNNNDKNKSIVYGYKTNYNDYFRMFEIVPEPEPLPAPYPAPLPEPSPAPSPAPSPSPRVGMADQLTGMGGRGRAGAEPGAHRSGRRASVAQGVAGPLRPGAVRVAVAR
jgi:predicted nucleotidyltransferase